MPQRVDAGVHAGHDRDAGVGDAVEAAEREGLGERAVGREQVVEVGVGHEPQTRTGLATALATGARVQRAATDPGCVHVGEA